MVVNITIREIDLHGVPTITRAQSIPGLRVNKGKESMVVNIMIREIDLRGVPNKDTCPRQSPGPGETMLLVNGSQHHYPGI